MHDNNETIPNHLVWAILTTVFCCLPLGIVSIVFASQVDTKRAAGDIEGARAASAQARLWALLSAGITVGFFALYFLFIVIVGGVGALNAHG